MATTGRYDIKDISLAAEGVRRIMWADRQMPVLAAIRERFAAELVDQFDVSVFAIKGEDNDTYYQHIEAAVDHKPQLTMDDGADVIGVLHSARREQLGDIIARSEEHTSELQSQSNLVCRLLLEKKKKKKQHLIILKKKQKK